MRYYGDFAAGSFPFGGCVSTSFWDAPSSFHGFRVPLPLFGNLPLAVTHSASGAECSSSIHHGEIWWTGVPRWYLRDVSPRRVK